MFTYPLKYQDALQAFVKYTKSNSNQVDFVNPVLNQLYADEAEGLCTITLRSPSTGYLSVKDTADSILEIHYTDPELEFVRKLQC